VAKITRSIDQVIFKHAPGSFIALEESGMFGTITKIKGRPDTEVDEKMLYREIKKRVKKWNEESENRVLGFNFDEIDESTIVAIKPEEAVLWDFLPFSLFECTNEECKILNDGFSKVFDGKCSECGSRLKQFKFVWYHPCGAISAFSAIPDTHCPTHGKKYLYLNDTGRFGSSTWRCRKCQHESSLRKLPCPNSICRKSIRKDKGESMFLQGAIWSDPWVYFSQTATFANLKDDQIKAVINSEIKDQLLISSYLGLIETGKGNLKKSAENINTVLCTNPECGQKILISQKYCGNCGTARTEVPKELKLDFKNDTVLTPLAEDSDIAIFAAVRDLNTTKSFKEEKNKQKKESDIEKVTLSEVLLRALNKIGIDDIYLIGDFPITHIAYGYTRFQSKPPSWLRSYPTLSSDDTRSPVYTNCVKTEAWMIQLSANYILNWLKTNDLLKSFEIDDLEEKDEKDSKLILLELLNKETEDENEKSLQKLIEQLIHSISHTLLYSLAVESGLDIASFGEILLPKTLTFIVYGGESDIGGLSASFQQGGRLICA
jgi:hypothetical protein